MRILIAIGVRRLREAGAAGVALNHALELKKLGHRVDCWFFDDIFKGPAVPQRFETLVFAAAVAKRILKRRSEFDVVNLHAPWGCVYGVWRKCFKPSGSPPYVMTMQGSEERYAKMMRIEQRKGLAWHFSWKNRVWHKVYHQRLYDYAIRTADFGVVANREAWIMAELKHGCEPGKVQFVPNGVEEQFFIEREYSNPGSRLLYVGSWLDRKGVHYLAQAFTILADKFAELTLTLAGFGDSEEAVRTYFAAGAAAKLRFMPFVARDEMPAVYARHDILVFPSLVEGMPLTLLEAMASGMPVVTTNTSGMADVVEGGENGVLVPPGNTIELVAGIEPLLASRDLRRKLGLAGQQTARKYTWDRVAQKLERVLKLAVRNEE